MFSFEVLAGNGVRCWSRTYSAGGCTRMQLLVHAVCFTIESATRYELLKPVFIWDYTAKSGSGLEYRDRLRRCSLSRTRLDASLCMTSLQWAIFNWKLKLYGHRISFICCGDLIFLPWLVDIYFLPKHTTSFMGKICHPLLNFYRRCKCS